MSATIDCPICMDCIESTTKNCVTTECGHCFHTNCLMQSVAHNGFGCPYCRTVMAEVPDEEETIYSDEEHDDEEDDEDEEMFDDDALRGFRFFWNLLNGEEHDEEDTTDEQEFDEWVESQNRTQLLNASNIPTPTFVAQKLQEQGVTFEQLVFASLNSHNEYHDNEENDRVDYELFEKIRSIITSYRPEQAQPDVVAPTVVQAPEPVVAAQAQVLEVDFAAQPKTVQVRSIQRINIHV